MEPVQILLFVVVSILTILLVAIGIQTFFILRKTGKTISKLYEVLENANLISSTVARPIVGVANLVEGIKGIKTLMDAVSPAKKEVHKEAEEGKIEKSGQEYIEHAVGSHIKAIQERGRRFFHRGGKPLTS